MEKIKEKSTQELERILRGHMTGQKEYPGEEILEVCNVLAERTSPKTDAAGIYRHYLGIFFPGETKNDL